MSYYFSNTFTRIISVNGVLLSILLFITSFGFSGNAQSALVLFEDSFDSGLVFALHAEIGWGPESGYLLRAPL